MIGQFSKAIVLIDSQSIYNVEKELDSLKLNGYSVKLRQVSRYDLPTETLDDNVMEKAVPKGSDLDEAVIYSIDLIPD